MTNPAGDVFISYKHSQQNLAEKLEIALRNHGIPVWRDVHDIGPDPLEQQIREDLQDSNLAGGVAIISSDVTQSPVILKTELPELHKRWRGDDEFFVVVVLAPGVDYDEAETILSKAESPYDLSHWYMESLEVEETSSSSSAIGRIINSILDKLGQNQKTSSQLPPLDAVVDAVLERRLQCIHNRLSSNSPVECSLDTYVKPSHDIQLAVSIDWSPHFDDGIPDGSLWNEQLLPALRTTTDYLQQETPGRELRFRGRANLPAVFSLGYCLPETRGISTAWMQPDQDGNFSSWRLNLNLEESNLQSDLEEIDRTASDLAVLVNITDDVKPEVGKTKSKLPDFNGILEFGFEEDSKDRLTAPEAAHAAKVFQQDLRDAMNRLPETSTIHLFMATPAGLAFLFGQMTNTSPTIQTYILDTESGSRTYETAAQLS
ncbi:SAVED domain-containing protein [Haloplanus rubicundus]|uniref:SAVED domain-containing protein n=1 Tax=Haloplanus rubicundus TaxID=1547898 RepID=A0A345E871_9EURY|nr:SAVED domain-containing protein [Haloplanus rubicundus]AXG08393.1 SAVED domain-containing protein [Haloplanus rubicundus]